jgi:hypothetical protein
MAIQWTALWFIIAGLIAFFIGGLNVPHLEHLTTRGVQTQATVTELTPKEHLTLRYEYQVDGKKFEQQGAPWRPNPPLDEIKVGDSLVIYYDPVYPSVSVLGDPKPMLTNELVSVGMAVLLMPTFIVLTLILRTGKDRPGEAATTAPS